MKNRNVPKHLQFIRGAIGKQFVIKRTPWGPIKTKYPDMSRIKASAAQRQCRNLFRDAVAFAKTILANATLKKEWKEKVRRRKHVFQQAIKWYMLKEKLEAQHRAAEERYSQYLKKKLAIRAQQPEMIKRITIWKGEYTTFYIPRSEWLRDRAPAKTG